MSNFEKELLDDLKEKVFFRFFSSKDLYNHNYISFKKMQCEKFFSEKKSENLAIVRKLERNGILNLIWDNEKVNIKYINVSRNVIDKWIYDVVELKKQFEEEIQMVENDYLFQIKKDYFDDVRLHKSIRKYLSKKVVEAIKIVDELCHFFATNSIEYQRNYSSRTFGDSKYIENHISEICFLMKINEDDCKSKFEEKGLLFNEPYVRIKGKCDLILDDCGLNLNKIFNPIEVSPKSKLKAISPIKIMIVENLTTFSAFEFDGLVFYSAGFQNVNSIKRFLIDFYNDNKILDCFHWGDIDYNGFLILTTLRKNMPFKIKSFKMNKNILEKYKAKTVKLNHHILNIEQYQKNIKDLIVSNNDLEEFEKQTLEYCLNNNIKLEQELIEE